MKNGFLNRIIAAKQARVGAAKRFADPAAVRNVAESKIADHRDFASAVSQANKINIIAEFKRASPSKGPIRIDADPADTARKYEAGGAVAISVLTEEDHFAGSLTDLRTVRDAVQAPVLRKDFIVDEYQIYESAAAGADAILLIAAILDDNELERFQSLARELGVASIVEVHDEVEMEAALRCTASMIGINNRDLKTFEVSLKTSRDLIELAPSGTIMISESGLSERDQVTELRELGYSAFLIGETLMRGNNPASVIRDLCND